MAPRGVVGQHLADLLQHELDHVARQVTLPRPGPSPFCFIPFKPGAYHHYFCQLNFSSMLSRLLLESLNQVSDPTAIPSGIPSSS